MTKTKPKTVTVRAGAGLRLPLAPGITVNSSLRWLTEDDAVEVVFNSFTRKRLRAKDMVEIKQTKKKATASKAKD